MDHKPRIYLMIIFLVIASLACSFSDLTGQATATQAPGSFDTAVAQSLAETSSIQTVVAQGVASVAAPTLGDSSPGGPTAEIQSSLTPTLTVSATSGKAMVSVSNVTNCRSGPGTIYDWLGALNPGQEVEILGKDLSNSSYYIKNPTNSSGFCWIWNTYATVTGDMAAVPVFTPMPTPTPAISKTPTSLPISYSATFSELLFCPANYYITINIVNTGTLTWQSWDLSIDDTVSSTTALESDDKFMDITGCGSVNIQDDLSPGETGKLYSGAIPSNPEGHLIKASIKLCSADGLAGTCISKSITFTP
jgi:hypothetical protein